MRQALALMAAKLDGCRDELNTLDGQLGDGDIGVMMSGCMNQALSASENLPDDVGMALMQCAREMTKMQSGSIGILLATGIMGAAKVAKGRTVVPWGETSGMIGEAITKMAQRGKSQLGDKTVLDALEAVRKATEGLDEPEQMLKAAQAATGEALRSFRGRACRQGRARIFAEKSKDLDDPGMVVVTRLIEAL